MSIIASVWRAAPLTVALAAALTLGACVTDSSTETTAAATPAASAATPAAPSATRTANAADTKVEVPLDEAQASARCWMKYDSSKMSLDQKSAAVDKCIDETLRNQKR